MMRSRRLRWSLLALALGGSLGLAAGVFTNPVVRSSDAPDPWVVLHGGTYYLTGTLDEHGGLWVWSAKTLSGLDAGRKVKVWSTAASGAMSAQVWAPELHWIRGKWYLYFTASDGVDANHREYVLEARTADPQGPYKAPVRVEPDFENYAIDGSVLEMPDGRLYWMDCANGVFIAAMSGPTRVTGPRVPLVTGTQDWEHAWRKSGDNWVKDSGYWVEAPEALIHGSKVFVAYSAGHTAANYFMGLMELRGSDPLKPGAWVKRPNPIFEAYGGQDGKVFAPGHGSFTTSRDGRETWLVYHAKDSFGGDFNGRTMRLGRVTWNKDGSPNLGHPIPSGVNLTAPAGENPGGNAKR